MESAGNIEGRIMLYGRITGWGKALPDKIVTNADLEKMVDTSDEWIVTRTGIRERRIAPEGVNTSTLSVQAGQAALEKAGLIAADLDLIIVASSSPDHLLPAVSSEIQHQLGAHCGAFTLVAGCTGFVYGLVTAQQFITTGAYRTILVIGAEVISRNVDWTDRNTCVLFGDGAGAVVVQACEEQTGLLAFELGSDGGGAEHLMMPMGIAHPATHETIDKKYQYIRMNGREVFKFATRTLARSAAETIGRSGLSTHDIDLMIPHQANARIIELAARQLGLPMEKVFVNIDKYGNTSAASIPIALTEAIEAGRVKEGDHLVLVGFGAGLTWASAVVQFGLAEKKVTTGWLAAPARTVRAAQNKISVAARTAGLRASLMLTPLSTRVSRKQRPVDNGNGQQPK
ncbi:3-oxoacyl-[acyl-carrier-protein] synthase III [Thermoflexales bacterium]|nr:3-oxoacyl-[acyl-carrier-protein] synthase III [Thermoflexales bacterium]